MSSGFYDARYTTMSAQLHPHQLLRLREVTAFCDRLEGRLAPGGGVPAICDLGSGRGWLAAALTKYGVVTGVEPSAVGVERARVDFGGDGRLRFVQGTTETLVAAGAAGSFDLVVSSEVIEHVEDQHGFMLGIRRLLRPGGHAILSTPRAAMRRAWEATRVTPQPVENWLSDAQFAAVVTAGGFTVLEHRRGFVEFSRLGVWRVFHSPRLRPLLHSGVLSPLRERARQWGSLYQFILAREGGSGRGGL